MSKTDRLDQQAVRTAAKYMGKVAWTTVILGLLFAAGISETWLYVMGFDVFFLGGVWAHMRRPREPAFVPLD